MTMGFAKIDTGILGSSIMEEDPITRLVWILMLVESDRYGVVDSTVAALARRFNLKPEQVSVAIDVLLRPDAESKSPASEGRRLVLLDKHRKWGWKIVNHALYRDARDPQERLDYKAEWARAKRGQTGTPEDTRGQVRTGEDNGDTEDKRGQSTMSPPSTRGQERTARTDVDLSDAESDAESDADSEAAPKEGSARPPAPAAPPSPPLDEPISAKPKTKVRRVAGKVIPDVTITQGCKMAGITGKAFEERVLGLTKTKGATAWQKEMRDMERARIDFGGVLMFEKWNEASLSGYQGCTYGHVRDHAERRERQGKLEAQRNNRGRPSGVPPLPEVELPPVIDIKKRLAVVAESIPESWDNREIWLDKVREVWKEPDPEVVERHLRAVRREMLMEGATRIDSNLLSEELDKARANLAKRAGGHVTDSARAVLEEKIVAKLAGIPDLSIFGPEAP